MCACPAVSCQTLSAVHKFEIPSNVKEFFENCFEQCETIRGSLPPESNYPNRTMYYGIACLRLSNPDDVTPSADHRVPRAASAVEPVASCYRVPLSYRSTTIACANTQQSPSRPRNTACFLRAVPLQEHFYSNRTVSLSAFVTMEARRPPEIVLDISADRTNVKDVVKGSNHCLAPYSVATR